MPSIDETDRVAFCNYVEAMMAHPAFQADQQNVSVLLKKALFRVGLAANDEWKTLMNSRDCCTPAQCEWFASQEAPVLSDQTLLTLCMGLRMREYVTVNGASLIVYERPFGSVPLFSAMHTEFSAVEPSLSKETESLMALMFCCPEAEVLFSTAFDNTHPHVEFSTITDKLTPLHQSFSARLNGPDRIQAYAELRLLFKHMHVNAEACGLSDWAKALARANSREQMDEMDQRWTKKEFRRQIGQVLQTRAELEEHLLPETKASLQLQSHLLIATESQSATASKTRLKEIFRGLRKDVELLCQHQPKESDKLKRLVSEFKLAAERRSNLLGQIDRQAVEDESEHVDLARDLEEPVVAGMDVVTKIGVYKKALAAARSGDEILSGYRITPAASIDTDF